MITRRSLAIWGLVLPLASARSYACARLTLANLKRSKATNSDAVSLLQVSSHALHHSREQILPQLLRQLMPFRKLLENAPQQDSGGSAF